MTKQSEHGICEACGATVLLWEASDRFSTHIHISCPHCRAALPQPKYLQRHRKRTTAAWVDIRRSQGNEP